ncbi:MAG: sulfatase-like hydrolase/transferase, partial [Acidobacteria bacterium]|nr:sulfatase-like hydrolase/transferase [Acidobacteriota bacterium]
TRFRNHFVTTAICAVSRASIFTGLYARCHGIHNFRPGFTEEQYQYGYPERLRHDAGYRTGFIGKYGVGAAEDVEAAGKHYDFFEGFPGQGKYIVEGRAHMTTHLGNQAVEFLDGSNKDQPWALQISFKAPHVQDGVAPYFLNDPKYDDLYTDRKLPLFPHMDGEYYLSLPKELKESENRTRWEQRFATPEMWDASVKRYYRLIHGVDVQMGRLFGELENRGMLDNTVVVFSGDNGFYLGERGFAGKWYMHEESFRTPLVIADPRRPASHGQVRSEMSLNIDIAPTIERLAGVELAPSINGRDLNPLVDGERPEWRKEFFYEHLFTHPKIPKSEGVRTETWSYFQFPELQPVYEEMYDLAHDPQEDHNLVKEPEHSDELDHLRARRKAWIANLEAWSVDKPWSEPAPSAA